MSKLKATFWWHRVRGHKANWYACGKWVTSVECFSCRRRWEDDKGEVPWGVVTW